MKAFRPLNKYEYEIEKWEAKLSSLVQNDNEADYLIDWFKTESKNRDYLDAIRFMYFEISKRGYIING